MRNEFFIRYLSIVSQKPKTMEKQIQVSEVAEKVISAIQKALSNTPTGVSFCSVKNYTNEVGEVSDYIFNIGVSYDRAKQKDIEFLTNLDVTTTEWNCPMVDIIKAKQELITSLEKPNQARSEGQKNAYTHIINGIKVHNETAEIYVYGMKVSKRVKQSADYGEDTRKPLTKAKDELRKLMKSAKYRQFIFKLDGMSVKASGEELLFEKPTA